MHGANRMREREGERKWERVEEDLQWYEPIIVYSAYSVTVCYTCYNWCAAENQKQRGKRTFLLGTLILLMCRWLCIIIFLRCAVHNALFHHHHNHHQHQFNATGVIQLNIFRWNGTFRAITVLNRQLTSKPGGEILYSALFNTIYASVWVLLNISTDLIRFCVRMCVCVSSCFPYFTNSMFRCIFIVMLSWISMLMTLRW